MKTRYLSPPRRKGQREKTSEFSTMLGGKLGSGSGNKSMLNIILNFDVLTLKRFKGTMKRATVYFEDDLHTALKIKAAGLSSSLSELVNEAVKDSLNADLEDLKAFRDRESEPTLDFESFVSEMKNNGRL